MKLAGTKCGELDTTERHKTIQGNFIDIKRLRHAKLLLSVAHNHYSAHAFSMYVLFLYASLLAWNELCKYFLSKSACKVCV